MRKKGIAPVAMTRGSGRGGHFQLKGENPYSKKKRGREGGSGE